MDLPVSPHRSHNFTCVSSSVHSFVFSFVPSFLRSPIRSLVRPLRVFIRIGSLVFSDVLHEVLGTIDAKKWRSSIFVENLFLPKFEQKGPQNRVFCIFFKLLSFVLPKDNARWKFFWFWPQTPCLVKFFFWSYCRKCSRPIRLQDSLKCN